MSLADYIQDIKAVALREKLAQLEADIENVAATRARRTIARDEAQREIDACNAYQAEQETLAAAIREELGEEES
jgi:hypothetical protein